MNIVKPEFVLEPSISKIEEIYPRIEKVARVCYKSEDKIGEGTAVKMVQSLIKRHHTAMLEHCDLIFQVTSYFFHQINAALMYLTLKKNRPYYLVLTHTNRCIISSNLRGWIEFLSDYHEVNMTLPNAMCTVFNALSEVFETPFAPVLSKAVLLWEEDLTEEEKWIHCRRTAKITTDRGIGNEIVRHRAFSYAQESTRYCNYNKDKFGSDISVISPFENDESLGYVWEGSMTASAIAYDTLINNQVSPQLARGVLPLSLKTELYMTGPLWAWKHFFDLRALDKTGPAHPQMHEVARPLYKLFQDEYPTMMKEELV